MDDMRSRYRMPRRDYARPVRRPPDPQRSAQSAPRPAPAPQPHVNAANRQPAPTPDRQAPPPAARRHTSRKKRSLLKPLVALLILAGLAGGGFLGYQKVWAQNPFPADIRSQSKLDLLYPSKLPAGYKIDKQNISLSDGILIYSAKNGGGSLVFTLQAAPANFDFDSFYKQQLQNLQTYPTAFGTANIGKNSGRYLGSLVDGDTWLLLTTGSADTSQQDMALVLTHLKRY